MGVDRQAFRAHELDGAALFFQPATGVHVRIENAATRAFTRRAPRVAMFGITNRCNLACDFCSRDRSRASGWTVASAAAALRGLAAAGTLEVAFGGGEPFAFRGFAELVAELDATTALAQHVTTNGTLLDRARWPAFAGRFGVVRLSIYDGIAWRGAAQVLADAGQRWGANVLCDRARLASLPPLLDELAALGAHDVSLLSYVGGDPARQLDRAGERALAAIIAASPLPCRVSVCLGDRLGVARLDGRGLGGDCGAGVDFVSVTPDRRVAACSFQDVDAPGATADEILDAWRDARVMRAASLRRGCARALPQVAPPPPPPIAVWRSFSGNNSGECVMVAHFPSPTEAEAYLAELAPDWRADQPYPEPWRALFAAEGVAGPRDHGEAPRELGAVGATVIAATYAADDAFPELRALAWKRGAEVRPGGVHVHDAIDLLVAVAPGSERARDALVATATDVLGARHAWPHGAHAVAVVPLLDARDRADAIAGTAAAVRAWAGAHRLRTEVVLDAPDAAGWIAARQRLGSTRALLPRATFSFWGQDGDRAERFAATIGERATVAGSLVLVDPAPDRKRLAVLGYRAGATVEVLSQATVRITGYVSWPYRRGPSPDEAPLRSAIDAWAAVARPGGARPTVDHAQSWCVEITVVTAAPAAALVDMSPLASLRGASLALVIRDDAPVELALRRVLDLA